MKPPFNQRVVDFNKVAIIVLRSVCPNSRWHFMTNVHQSQASPRRIFHGGKHATQHTFSINQNQKQFANINRHGDTLVPSFQSHYW